MPSLTLPPHLRRAKPEAPPAPPAAEGFEYAKAPSTRAAKWTRIAWRTAVVALLALVLVNVIQNIRANNRAASTPAAVGVDQDSARVTAATATSDYLFHNPLVTSPGQSPAHSSFTGVGYLSTDLVIPGSVTSVDATHAVVAVQARVVIGMPGNADAATAAVTTTAPAPGRAANAAALPAGYKVVANEWLPLQVPVVRVGSTVSVDANGPVFSADPPAPLASVKETDSTATGATTDWVKTLFTSYALGSVSGAYLSAPGVDLVGLSGAVTVSDIPAWKLSAAAPDGSRTGTAKVAWTFAPTADLTTTQQYVVATTTSDNRWYATALGATVSPPSTN